jgi:hypothetical protein
MGEATTTTFKSKEAIHSFLTDTRDYVGFVNRIAELIQVTEMSKTPEKRSEWYSQKLDSFLTILQFD